MDLSSLHGLPMRQAIGFYSEALNAVRGTAAYWPLVAALSRRDRFFLLTHVLKRVDLIHPWLYARCREVEAHPDGYLDLWARFHGKSSIVTFGGVMQEIIRDPEITIGILSYNNATATAFLSQIKQEMEKNEDLHQAFPEIFYANPKKDSAAWSLDKGIMVKRQSNPKENTVEAYGLVDNQPTGRHFKLRVYDDVVTLSSVTSPEMIDKTTASWEISLNLGAGKEGNRQWYVGTRYNTNDTYHEIIQREYLIPRIYPATDDGTPDGQPVFMTPAEWADIKKGVSEMVLACQQLLNPVAGSLQEFKPDWVRRYEVRPRNLNVYITCDPAGGKKDYNCNTAMLVIGVDPQLNKYLLDGACHRMGLSERWTMLKQLVRKWQRRRGVQGVTVGYEKYSMQADIEHFETMMKLESFHFPIEEVGGSLNKNDRIRRLIPDHQNWRFFYPETSKVTGIMQTAVAEGDGELVAKKIKRTGNGDKVYELVDWFLRNEYPFFPSSTLKDMLDAMCRIYDLDLRPPMDYTTIQTERTDENDNYGGPCYYEGELMEPAAEEI